MSDSLDHRSVSDGWDHAANRAADRRSRPNAARPPAVHTRSPPLSPAAVWASLRRPTARDWATSLKAYAAVALALWFGFSQNLDNPYWSALTVYVVAAQPQSGAVRSKALFRLLGTAIGGALSVLLAGLFGDQVGAFLVGLMVVVLGALYLQQLDRSPAAYFHFAIALTAAVVGFVHLLNPDAIFTFAAARVAEITVGIAAFTIVDAVFWPLAMTPSFLATMSKWREEARVWVAHASERPQAIDERLKRRERLRSLTAQLAAIDGALVQLPYDVTPVTPRRRDLRLLRATVLDLLAEFAGVGVWRRAVARLPKPSELTTAALNRVDSWFAETDAGSALANADHVRRGDTLANDLIRDREGLLGAAEPDAILQAATLTRLIALVRSWADLEEVLGAVETRERLSPRLTAAAKRTRTVRSADYLIPVMDVAPAAVAMAIAAAVWWFTAWSSGTNALLFAFLGCFFLIAQQPASLGSIVGLLLWTALAFALAFFYLYVALPRATAYPVLIGLLGMAAIPLGLFAEMGVAGLVVLANGFAFLGLQNAYQADFDQSLLSMGGSLAGVLFAGVARYLCRYDRPRIIARRLMRGVRMDVADAAGARKAPSLQRFYAVSVDRLSLLFTAIADLAPDDRLSEVDMIADFRVGANLLVLRQDEGRLSPACGGAVLSLRRAAAEVFRDYARGRRGPQGLLNSVERSFAVVEAAQGEPQRERLLMALTGLRLALEPNARLNLSGAGLAAAAPS